jgi:hypothetical protein
MPALPPDADGADRVDPTLEATTRRSPVSLYRHADMGPMRRETGERDCFDQLATLCEPENWAGHGVTAPDPTWTLRCYVEATFERAYRQRSVLTSPDGAYSVFHVGLETPGQESVFGVFTPNMNPDSPPWQFSGWFPESERGLHDNFPELPRAGTYAQDPVELIYDWRQDVFTDVRNLLAAPDNLAVLPEPLRGNPYQAGLVLEGAVRRATLLARRDYRAAVPGWDPIAERIRLFFPLSLITPERVDAALVVSRDASGYRADTVVSLGIAYARARILCRPADWLTASS